MTGTEAIDAHNNESGADSDSDIEFVGETDGERRAAVLAATNESERVGMRATLADFADDLVVSKAGTSAQSGPSRTSMG